MARRGWIITVVVLGVIAAGAYATRERWLPLLPGQAAEPGSENAAASRQRGGGGGGGARRGRFGGGGPQLPTSVLAVAAKTEDVPVTVTGVGTAQPLASVTVVAQVDGQLVQVMFKEGQDVKKGDVLAKLDDRSYQAALDQAKGKQAQDQATLDNAKRDLERYTMLAASNSVTRQQADTQRSTVAVAQALVLSDQAAVASAEVTLGYTTITAPIDGRTGIQNVDQGNIVHTSDATGIVTISQIRPIAVVFTVPQQQLAAINKASAEGPLAVDVLDGAGTVIDHGTLLVVDNQVDQTTGTVKLKASFPNDQLAVWPGAFVNARLHVSTLKDALVIPSQAVQRGPDGTFVYRVKDQQTAEMVKVTVGQQDDQQAVITDGIVAGDPIITTGFVRLNDGSKVQVADANAAPVANPEAGNTDRSKRRAGQGQRSGGQGNGNGTRRYMPRDGSGDGATPAPGSGAPSAAP